MYEEAQRSAWKKATFGHSAQTLGSERQVFLTLNDSRVATAKR